MCVKVNHHGPLRVPPATQPSDLPLHPPPAGVTPEPCLRPHPALRTPPWWLKYSHPQSSRKLNPSMNPSQSPDVWSTGSLARTEACGVCVCVCVQFSLFLSSCISRLQVKTMLQKRFYVHLRVQGLWHSACSSGLKSRALNCYLRLPWWGLLDP